MPTDVREQVRQLVVAFDEVVDDVSAEEVIGFDASVTQRPRSPQDVARRPRLRLGVAAAAACLVVGLVATLGLIGRDGSEPASLSAPPPATNARPPTTTVAPGTGQFAWPAPPRDYDTVSQLIGAFTDDVLGWTAYDIVGDLNDQDEPQSFTLHNNTIGASVPAIATPSPHGWGFVQLGASGMSASFDQPDQTTLEFPEDPAAESYSVTVHLTDGTTIDSTATAGLIDLPGIELEQIASALVVGVDADGQTVAVSGGQFVGDGTVPLTTPTIDDGSAITIDDERPDPSPTPAAAQVNDITTSPYATIETPIPAGPISAFDSLNDGESRVVVDNDDVTIEARYEPSVTAPYCVDLTLDGFDGPACGDREAWTDPTTFGIPSGDRTRKLVGQIVPDTVSSVTTSDGRTITPVLNVWWDVGPIDSAVMYVVHTTDGRSTEPFAAQVE